MYLQKVSPIDSKVYGMEIPITESQLEEFYRGNTPIQNFFPQLTPDQREFILSGITPEQWDKLFLE
jgi:hypothetical protein